MPFSRPRALHFTDILSHTQDEVLFRITSVDVYTQEHPNTRNRKAPSLKNIAAKYGISCAVMVAAAQLHNVRACPSRAVCVVLSLCRARATGALREDGRVCTRVRVLRVTYICVCSCAVRARRRERAHEGDRARLAGEAGRVRCRNALPLRGGDRADADEPPLFEVCMIVSQTGAAYTLFSLCPLVPSGVSARPSRHWRCPACRA